MDTQTRSGMELHWLLEKKTKDRFLYFTSIF